MTTRDARAEAAARVGGDLDVRVLEPSPPALTEPPYFADDPVAGGDVVPVERDGARSWARLCESRRESDPTLVEWCRQRWLVPGPLQPLPPGFATTRASLHRVAEHVLAPWRHAAVGRIGLRYTFRGFGTPFVPGDRQLRIEDGELVDGDRRLALSTVASAAEFVGVEPGAPAGLYPLATPVDPDRRLEVDPAAGRALGAWYGFCASLLEQVRADEPGGAPDNRLQLWPEHLDLAVDLGPEGQQANYGGSPGDEDHAEPYLYVGPFEPREGPFWNEPFGASLGYGQILAGADPLAFLRRGRALVAGAG